MSKVIRPNPRVYVPVEPYNAPSTRAEREESVAELLEQCRKEAEEDRIRQARQDAKDKIVDQLIDAMTEPCPQIELEKQECGYMDHWEHQSSDCPNRCINGRLLTKKGVELAELIVKSIARNI